MSNVFNVVLIGNGTMATQGVDVLVGLNNIKLSLIVCDSNDDGVDSMHCLDNGVPFRMSLRKKAVELGYEEGNNLIMGRANSKRVLEHIASFHPDVILSLQCRDLLSGNFLTIAKFGCLNIHNAPLPLLRGCDPFAWAVHDGLKVFGVTLHCVDLGCDSGDIVAQETFRVEDNDTAWMIFQKSLPLSSLLLKKYLVPFLKRDIYCTPQNERFVTYHPMGQFQYRPIKIEWDTVAVTLSAWIRARVFPPFQLPYFYINNSERNKNAGVKVEVLQCRSRKVSQKTIPGKFSFEDGRFRVDAKWGVIELNAVKVDGRIFRGVELLSLYQSIASNDC
jgi:methionyl-tRNA formyltransferase